MLGGKTVVISPQPGRAQTMQFDRSRLGEKVVVQPILGLGPLSPYAALRAFLTNGAGLVLLALAALVLFPARARAAVERLESRYSAGIALDRKSTRLNSSHSSISYAVFCLKKK